MAQAPSASDAPPVANLDIILRPLEGDAYLVQGVAEGFGETETLPTQFTPDLFTFVEKSPQILQSDLVSYGQQLYELLFPEALSALYYRLQDQLVSGEIASLRLRLNATDGTQLYNLPWEFLHNGRDFLVLDTAIALVRFLPRADAPLQIRPVPPTILMAMVQPEGAEDALERFMATADYLRSSGKIEIETVILSSAESMEQLYDLIHKLAPTVLHLVAPTYTTIDGLPSLPLPDGAMTTGQIMALLKDTAVSSIVLDKLENGRSPDAGGQSALAVELIREGVPVVLTVPHALPSARHTTFWLRYYTAINDGLAVDTAVGVARQALHADNRRDIFFGIPRLYTSLADLNITESVPESDENEPFADSSNLYTADIASQQMPLSEVPVQQRPLTKGGSDSYDTFPGDTFIQTSNYDAEFVNHVTVPQFAEMPPGQTFAKTWRVLNTGVTDWRNGELQIAHKSGESFSQTLSYNVRQQERGENEIIAAPGRSLDLSLELVAPEKAGEYQGEWQLRQEGEWFGEPLPVAITIPEPEMAQAESEPAYTGLTGVAYDLLNLGQYDRAVEVALNIDQPEDRREALTMLARELARREEYERLTTVTDLINKQPETAESTPAGTATTVPAPDADSQSPPIDPQPPRERHIWLFQADASDDNQIRLLDRDADPLIWGANPNTRIGDLVLMYRQSPLQDFVGLFTAVTDAVPQTETDLPAGWDAGWTHAVQLSERIRFNHPLPRRVAHSHPDLNGWNLMRTPQGSLTHTTDLRGYADGNWPALWTLLLAWNPDQWPDLSPYIDREVAQLRRDAFASLTALPASDEKWEATARFLQTLPAGHRLWQTAVASDDLSLWQAALTARDQFPPEPDTLIAKAEALTFNQQPQGVISLLTEVVSSWPGSAAQQARLFDLLARAYKTIGQAGDARDAWRQAAKLDPNQHQSFIRLVNTTPDAELDDLQLEFEQWAADHPDAAGPRAGLATIAREKQEDAAASEHIDAAIARASAVFRAELENLRPVTVTTTAPVPVIDEEPDPVLRRKQDRLRRFMHHHFSRLSDLVDLIDDLHISIDNLHGEILNHKIISLVNVAKSNGRLLELEMEIIRTYRRSYNPGVTDWLDRADICLRLGRADDALTELDRWRSFWETDASATIASRARGYSLHAQIHEALQQPATDLWLQAAALRPDDTAAYEGVVRTAPADRLGDMHTALTALKNSHPDAAGPKVGLAALAQRRAQAAGDDKDVAEAAAADMANELRDLSGSLVQEARARRLADQLRAEPASARTISLADLRPPAAEADTGSSLALTLNDLSALTNRAGDTMLQLEDQQGIIEQFLATTLALPTLSAGHKRELSRRADYVLRAMKERDQLTSALVADLHLPALDGLFIDKPEARKALLQAAADYRALPARRLVLRLRQRARKRLLSRVRTWVKAEADPAQDLPDTAVVTAELVENGTVTLPGAGDFILADLWTRAINEDRRQAQWQQADPTFQGYPAPALPAVAARQIQALAVGFWPIVGQLLFRQNGRFRYATSWERLQSTTLNDDLARRLLHLAHPDSHPDLRDATTAAALRRLGLADLANQLDAQTTAEFCRRLREDEDLGLHSLDDATLFLTHLAEGAVEFAPEPLPDNGRGIDIHPPLDTAVAMHPDDIATNLVLPPDTFRKMASTLSAGSHIILIGPPGTGKTTIAQDVCRHAHDQGYCRGFISATATADWTTFDTVGGYMPNAANQLEFREGIILRAIREQKWLVIDEINRADIDKAFGELFTVLSGQAVTLPYRDGYHPIRILPPDEAPLSPADYVIPESWRILGTMNEYDKASLFQMSFAFMRRFAFVDVAIPDDDVFAGLIDIFWRAQDLPENHPLHGRIHAEIFRQGEGGHIMASRALGPAIAKDMIGYLAQRHAHTGALGDDDLCEAFLMYALPQFDGMDEAGISQIFKLLSVYFADTRTIFGLRRRVRELFPQYAPAFAADPDIPDLLADWRTELGLEAEESEGPTGPLEDGETP